MDGCLSASSAYTAEPVAESCDRTAFLWFGSAHDGLTGMSTLLNQYYLKGSTVTYELKLDSCRDKFMLDTDRRL